MYTMFYYIIFNIVIMYVELIKYCYLLIMFKPVVIYWQKTEYVFNNNTIL